MFPMLRVRGGALLALLVMLVGALTPLARAQADDTKAAYKHAVSQAERNAANPELWAVNDLATIQGAGSGDGNHYVGSQLLVRTFTKQGYYEDARVGDIMTAYGAPSESAMWVTIGEEYRNYLNANKVTADTVHLETSRALGMFSDNSNDIFLEMLVTPDLKSIQRPTKDPAISRQPTSLGSQAPFVQPAGMSNAAYADFTTYYTNWAADAYTGSDFPWTQLGYTYVWGHGDELQNIRGLSEFIIPGGSSFQVYGVYALQSYLYTGGNGSGDFRVTGNLDTLWAGRHFQPYGDSVYIAPNAMVHNGQGLLVSSGGYLVENHGVITGATEAKFGIDGTRDIAVLFQGRTPPADAQAPARQGNELVNHGRISSPGTAVRADGLDTRITNTGLLEGGEFAVITGAGNDTLANVEGAIVGRIDLGPGSDTLSASGGRFEFGLDTKANAVLINNVESVELSQSTVAFEFHGDAPLRGSREITLAAGDLQQVSLQDVTLASNLPMVALSYDSQSSQAGALTVTARRDTSWYGRNVSNRSLGWALDAAAGDASLGKDMDKLLVSLDTSDAPASNAGQLAPVSPGGQARGAYTFIAAFSNAFAASLMQTRSPAAEDAAAAAVRPSGLAAGQQGDDADKVVAFADVFAYSQHADAANGASAYDGNGSGTLVGLGYRLTPDVAAGVLAAYGENRLDFDRSGAWSRDRSFRLGAWAALTPGVVDLDLLFDYGHHSVDTARRIDFLGRRAEANYTMDDLHAWLRLQREFTLAVWNEGRFWTRPFGEAQLLWLWQQAYDEEDAAEANMQVKAHDQGFFTSTLGAALGTDIGLGKGAVLSPSVQAGWQHQFLEAEDLRAAFAAAPSLEYDLPATPLDRNAAKVGASLELRLQQWATVYLRGEATLADKGTSGALLFGADFQF